MTNETPPPAADAATGESHERNENSLTPLQAEQSPSAASAEPAETDAVRFEDFGLPPEILRALEEMGYDMPMEVQVAVYQKVMAGQDLMVQARTGTGKTAAFGIPLIQQVGGESSGAQALILAPTRELALQVARELQQITKYIAGLEVVPVYGGAPMKPQIDALAAGAQIVVGTPGRVLDHARRRTLNTKGIRKLILDECDEMLSMGFQEEIEAIIDTLPERSERQSLLFSATIPNAIQRIARRNMRDPEEISLSTGGISVDEIEHYYYLVSGMARTRDLVKVLQAERPESALIFCNTRDDTSTVAKFLARRGYNAEAISSDLSQPEREEVMKRMRAGKIQFLAATDVAARGIDISDLSHVINYTFPDTPEVYVHRTGRTGRAGKRGVAISLVGPREIGNFYYLKLTYKLRPEERELPSAEELAALEEGERYEQVRARVPEEPSESSRALARRVWQSAYGERIVGALLERLFAEPARKAKPASARERVPAESERSDEAPEPRRAESASERPESEGDRRKLRSRRRRGKDEDRRPSARNEGKEPRETADATPDEGGGEERPERPRRRRSRRRGRAEEGASAESVAPEPGSEESEKAGRRRPRRSESEGEEAQGAEESGAAVRDENGEAKPRRRRSRRARPGRDETPESSAAPSGEEEAKSGRRRSRSAKTSRGAAAEGAPADEEANAGRRRRRRRRRGEAPRRESDENGASERPIHRPLDTSTETGEPKEFWEAWADEKQEERPQARAADGGETPSASGDAITARLYVNLGKRESITAEELRDFLGEGLGEDAERIGSVVLRSAHAYVRVPDELADKVIEKAAGRSYGDREVVVERAR